MLNAELVKSYLLLKKNLLGLMITSGVNAVRIIESTQTTDGLYLTNVCWRTSSLSRKGFEIKPPENESEIPFLLAQIALILDPKIPTNDDQAKEAYVEEHSDELLEKLITGMMSAYSTPF